MTKAAKRPLSVTIISLLYIVTGVGGLIGHSWEQYQSHTSPGYGFAAIVAVEIIAILSGAFMLRGNDWARWLALAWMAFHVYLGALNGWRQGAIHAAFLVVIGYFLLRRPAAEYFRAQDDYSAQPKED